jgi:hypothetical protein
LNFLIFRFVQIGSLEITKKYWLHIYNEDELIAIGKKGKKSIFNTSKNGNAYSLGKWIIDDGVVIGIYLESKV